MTKQGHTCGNTLFNHCFLTSKKLRIMVIAPGYTKTMQSLELTSLASRSLSPMVTSADEALGTFSSNLKGVTTVGLPRCCLFKEPLMVDLKTFLANLQASVIFTAILTLIALLTFFFFLL